MDRVGIGGLSLTAAGIAELERFKGVGEAALDDYLRELADALFASELVLLSTCNRVEVVFAREEGHEPSQSDLPLLARALGADGSQAHGLRLVRSRAAVQHLFRVTCSLDSVVQGEDQILGQVRSAFMRSRRLGLTGPILEPLFEGALQVGKQVRSQTELSRHPISVTSVGVARLLAKAPRRAEPLEALVIGAGSTGRLAAQALQGAGIRVRWIVNRSLERAQLLARDCGAQALSLEQFQALPAAQLGGIDVLVSATASHDFVVARSQLTALAEQASCGAGLFALDLALPRDLEPCEASAGVAIVDLEEVQRGAEENRCLRAAAAGLAEQLVERKIRSFERRAAEKRATDQIASFQKDSHELLEREMRQLSLGPLAGLPPEILADIRHWAHSAFGRANHLSLSFCKRLARDVPHLDSLDEDETTG